MVIVPPSPKAIHKRIPSRILTEVDRLEIKVRDINGKETDAVAGRRPGRRTANPGVPGWSCRLSWSGPEPTPTQLSGVAQHEAVRPCRVRVDRHPERPGRPGRIAQVGEPRGGSRRSESQGSEDAGH
jgi:hypothetical protein